MILLLDMRDDVSVVVAFGSLVSEEENILNLKSSKEIGGNS
jgi:hypothetical protein